MIGKIRTIPGILPTLYIVLQVWTLYVWIGGLTKTPDATEVRLETPIQSSITNIRIYQADVALSTAPHSR